MLFIKFNLNPTRTHWNRVRQEQQQIRHKPAATNKVHKNNKEHQNKEHHTSTTIPSRQSKGERYTYIPRAPGDNSETDDRESQVSFMTLINFRTSGGKGRQTYLTYNGQNQIILAGQWWLSG